MRYLATEKPSFDTLEGSVHSVLLFAVTSIIWLGSGFLQWVWAAVFYERFYHHPIFFFVDSLSVANISVLLLDETGHGYYIHGKSVHSHSDTTFDEMNQNFEKEMVFETFFNHLE